MADSVDRTCDSWSGGCEFESHVMNTNDLKYFLKNLNNKKLWAFIRIIITTIVQWAPYIHQGGSIILKSWPVYLIALYYIEIKLEHQIVFLSSSICFSKTKDCPSTEQYHHYHNYF